MFSNTKYKHVKREAMSQAIGLIKILGCGDCFLNIICIFKDEFPRNDAYL
jgi:hypothetical protein